jgi:eukaryotic-like serine/threonine-protein kinase
MKAGDLVGGKYRLVRRLGQGAMGVVWEAVHDVTARHVAMKLIVNATDNLRMRLLREARAAGKISHRNVVEVFDIGETEEQDPFLVMQLLVGETLYAVFKRDGSLEQKRGLTILRDICRALVAAHTQGIIHRDLKPANVFLHREAGSQGDIVKVLDFGLCKPMGDNEMLTTPGGMLGSPAYMAPEQIIGVSDLDPRTDIWALGVLGFEMFAGKRPFQGRGPDLIHAVLKDPIPRLRDVVPGIDPDLDEVIAGCIVRDRNQRFAQAADVVARLELLADRAERNEPREAMGEVDEEADLGVTQVYRPGSPLPVQTFGKGVKPFR